jgi:hypothetical protein
MVSKWTLVHFFHFSISFFLGVTQGKTESPIIYGWVKAHYNDPLELSHCIIFQGCACLCVSHLKLFKDFLSMFLHTMLKYNLSKKLEKKLLHFIL